MTEPDQTPPPASSFGLRSQRLGALPIIERFLERIGARRLLERHLPPGDGRTGLAAATVIGVLIGNLCVAREPLYGLVDWAARYDPALLGLDPEEAVMLNDDRVGRALDQLFDCDRGSLLTALMLGVISEFSVDCSQLHNDIATWDGLVALVGRPDFLYVADSKLATREQMTHIHARAGRFLSILPRSRAEDPQIREWAQSHAFDWTEAARRPGKRQGDPDQVYWTAPAPIPTSEGHRIVWTRSSHKHERDAEWRRERIEQGMLALESVQARLAGPRTRIKTLVAAHDAAEAALTAARAGRWITYQIAETIEDGFRQEKRGRPGPDTRYRKTQKTIFTLTFTIDHDKVAYDAQTDGCFPLVSNDHDLTDSELLAAYRYQPNLEKRHHQLKSVLGAAPIELKSPARIEALACCQFIALLAQCLIERELRTAMTRENVTELALYHEGRTTRAPTAARVFDLYADTTRHHLTTPDGQTVQTFNPDLDDLQRQVLDLLGLPADAYLTPPGP